MNRTARLVALAATTAIALTALVATAPSQAATATSTVAKVVKVLPTTVKLAPGDSVKVRLSTNLTTGYSWSTKVTGDKSAVTVSKGVYKEPANSDGMVGVAGTTTWTITAKSGGTAMVTFLATPPGGGKPTKDGVLTVIAK